MARASLDGRGPPALPLLWPLSVVTGPSVQFSSVAQSCLTLCDPTDCCTPGLPVSHQLLEVTQTHVHRVGDATQPSHPLPSPFSAALRLSQHQGIFRVFSGGQSIWPSIFPSIRVFSGGQSIGVSAFNITPSNEHSGLISFRMGWLDLLAVQGTLKKSSPIPQFKSIYSSVLSFLYSPTLISIHDH